jgi:hypothetical protein
MDGCEAFQPSSVKWSDVEFGIFVEAQNLQNNELRSSHCSCNVPSSVVIDPLSSSGDSSAVAIMDSSAIVQVIAIDIFFFISPVVDFLGYRVVGGYIASEFRVCGDKGCIDAPAV